MKVMLRTCILLFVAAFASQGLAADVLDLWFTPDWKEKGPQAKAITEALSGQTGLEIKPRIAASYPQIIEEFATGKPALVYVGSFVQAILRARGLGEGLVQAATGKEMYAGVLVYPKGQDPAAILRDHPAAIAYAQGASSGESVAKAATNGQAAVATKGHDATCGAVKAGKAKAGVVKNWWWAANSGKFPELEVHQIPELSEAKNPDNVLTASKGVTPEVKAKIKQAAKASKDAFGANEMVDFDPATLDFTLSLMTKGKIDPMTYSW